MFNKLTTKKYILLFLIIFGGFLTGCRQGPAKEPPKYYERELARMKKEEAKKVQQQINNAKDKIKAAAEEKKKQLLKQREEEQKRRNQATKDNTGNKVNYTPSSYDPNNSKRRQNGTIVFDQELIDMCVQCCCCNVF